MISFNLHIPSIFIGVLIGYIFVSVLWIALFFDENWERGFGEGYEAARKIAKREYEELQKTVKDSEETGEWLEWQEVLAERGSDNG